MTYLSDADREALLSVLQVWAESRAVFGKRGNLTPVRHAVEAIAARVAAETRESVLAPFEGLVDLWTGRETTDREYAMYQELRQALADARRDLRGGEDRG